MLKNASTQYRLPADSFYRGVEKQIADRSQGGEKIPRTPTTVFAKKILRDVESRGHGGVIARGMMSTSVLWINWLLPGWVVVSLLFVLFAM